MAPRLVITRRLPEAVESRARDEFDVQLNEADRPWTSQEILVAVEGADALLPCVADHLGAALISALPASVRIIANFGVGLDHMDIEAAKARKLIVTNTPGVLTDATADLTLLLILGATRRANEGMREIAESSWPGWAPTHLLGHGLKGLRLGIVGMGRIGKAVAARARAFGMEVHYHNRNRLPDTEEAGASYHDTLDTLLRVSEVLSLHCAATKETRGLIDRDALARLPRRAVLVNTARGDIVDDNAVIEALGSGRLQAAGLDVFRNEPSLDPRYRQLPNVMLLPHLGSATIETRTAMGMLALNNLEAFFAGREPPNRVA